MGGKRGGSEGNKLHKRKDCEAALKAREAALKAGKKRAPLPPPKHLPDWYPTVVRDACPDVFEFFTILLDDGKYGEEHDLTDNAFKWGADLNRPMSPDVRRKFAVWVIEKEQALREVEVAHKRKNISVLSNYFRIVDLQPKESYSKSAEEFDRLVSSDNIKYEQPVNNLWPVAKFFKKLGRQTYAHELDIVGQGYRSISWESGTSRGDAHEEYATILDDAYCLMYAHGRSNDVEEVMRIYKIKKKEGWKRSKKYYQDNKKNFEDMYQNKELARRRLPETPSVSPQDPSTPALLSSGSPTGLIAVLLLALAFLFYWFVVRRFRRPVRKPRDSLRDLEAGCAEVGRSLCLE